MNIRNIWILIQFDRQKFDKANYTALKYSWHTVRGVLFENCVIRENLIRELQYLRWNVLLAIGTKKEVRENFNVNYQLATDKSLWKIPRVRYYW